MANEENEVYLTKIQNLLPSHLLVQVPKLIPHFQKLEALVPLPKELPELLKKGIYFALLQSVVRLLNRETDPLLPEIVPEYKELVRTIIETYESLKPEVESNWLDECIQFGDKSAYHWEWKHFDSKELF
ncbi:LIC_11502 family protein [Leptospira levettii]|uniref:DUF5071 domain-containing protein n=1 Tax=Leptospira levettii TaxID=2023178 RepID=A0ABY2MML1_9LEPT|nr:hypothetical protein [Leptospira levettii]PKA27389.1 hypothetical protein CH381_05310 [Leptospira sp. mixed culture ATI2-C-A1]TGL03660.1 hypothetical protein EHQ39_17215 [Leptospira levettii]TGL69553.1 hypothetical protein EHQ60_11900 [Leptospira levettii]TGM25770.1 hypothetical protein EHQ74_13035 [Leptospira levettii]TGM91696.1 hypothetical protein EHR02_02395 [Leptospira levettii]